MSFIKSRKLVHEFKDYDEEENEYKVRAIDGVDLDVEEGQFIAILGHNGSGKSTFARHLNVLLKPTSGDLWINGLDASEDKNKWEIRQSTGMVFQNPDNQIIANIVEEDVGFGPENLGIPTKGIWQRVNHALRAVGMEKYRKHSPNKLSGGQKQRVAIAGVMAMKPRCIVLDEPTAMLDPSGRKEVISAVERLNDNEGVTVILITHHMEEVLHADKVFVMDDGKVVLSGTPKEVFSQVEKMKELSLEVPQVTELAYELEKSGIPMSRGIITRDEFIKEIQKLQNTWKLRVEES